MMIVFMVNAQHIENSPYSRYGIGDLYNNQYIQTSAMGGISMGYRSANAVNYSNPASYSVFDSLSFLFEAGMGARYTELNSSTASQRTGGANFSHIVCGFPVYKNIRASMGLVPFSKKNYLMSNAQTIDSIGEVTSLFNGSGGVNRLYFGTGIMITKWLSLGANASYLFGGINQEQNVSFPVSSNFFNTNRINSVYVSDFTCDLGIQTHFEFKKGKRLNLGFDWQPSMDLNAKRSTLTRTFLPTDYSGIIRVKDTVENITDEKGILTLPDGLSFGVVYQNPGKFTAGIDAGIQNWSKFSSYGINDSLKNSSYVALGMEYIPNINAIKGYLNKIHYRAGFRYNQSYLQLKNTTLTEFAITAGFGLPLRSRAKKYSLMNVAVEVGKRGTMDNGLIEEKFIRGTVSFSLYENWFHKRKYD